MNKKDLDEIKSYIEKSNEIMKEAKKIIKESLSDSVDYNELIRNCAVEDDKQNI